MRLRDDPKFIIAMSVIISFFMAYIYNPTDMMTGALLGAFTTSVTFYLGSSTGRNTQQDQLGQALNLATAGMPETATTTTTVTTEEKKDV